MRLFGLLPACAFALAAQDTGDNPGMYGVWWRGGNDPAAVKKAAPFTRGVFAAIPWSELEPADGTYDWAMFDAAMARYADAGLYIQFMIWVGPHSPRWIYPAGVPEVKTTLKLNPRGEPHQWTYPFYLDSKYKTWYHRMIRAVAAHIDTLPPALRTRIVCLQTAEGTTGDEGGYKGDPLDPRYELPEDQWRAFKFETWKLFESLYRPKQPAVKLLVNSGNQGQYDEWLNRNIPDAWRKAGNPGHGYQLNDETKMMAFFDPLINHPESGKLLRVRSEMDEVFKGWFQEAPVWNMYWLNVWALHFGLDIFQHETRALTEPAFAEGFRFFERYGGWKNAATAPGAFCALRDGLDAADFTRFPKEKFGAGSMRGPAEERSAGLQRTLRIAQVFAPFGAAQGDPEKAMTLVMQNRDAKKMNDVGWNIEAGNYHRYLKQWDPDGTSQGYWRQGPRDQPYGRFARGFDAAGGKNAMYFDLDDRFYDGKPVTVRVVYFDSGGGGFTLQYDAAGAPAKTALTVTKGNSGRWKEASVRLQDARFRNRCPHATDLVLANTSDVNTLFHLVEVRR